MVTITGPDLKAEIVRRRRALYEVAAQIHVHPCHLSRILNGKARLTDELKLRVLTVLNVEDREVDLAKVK